MVLIDHLPAGSSTMAEIRDGMTREELAAAQDKNSKSFGRWSRTDLILAEVIDATRTQTWVLGTAQGAFKKRLPAPEPFPRPGLDLSKPSKPRTMEELKQRVDPRSLAVAEALRNRMPIPEFID
jgi:hypothetical protein